MEVLESHSAAKNGRPTREQMCCLENCEYSKAAHLKDCGLKGKRGYLLCEAVLSYLGVNAVFWRPMAVSKFMLNVNHPVQPRRIPLRTFFQAIDD